MQISTLGLVEIASLEGICLSPYKDSVGVLTWGVGHTAAAGAPDPEALLGRPDATMAVVFEVFRQDLAAVVADVNRFVKVLLTQSEFDALCSFHYNTGGLGRANLLKALNAGDYSGAADGFLGWLKPPEIEGRRRKEMALFREGTYSSGGKALVFPVSASLQPLYSRGKSVDVAALLGATDHVAPPDVPLPPPAPTPPPEPVSTPVVAVGIFAVLAAAVAVASADISSLFRGILHVLFGS